MTTSRAVTASRHGMIVIGFVAAAAVLLSWRIPPASGRLGADVRVLAVPVGEVAVAPAGPFATARALEPGAGSASGRATLLNVAGGPVALRLRARPSSRDLDRVVRMTLRVRDRVIASGPLGTLRSWSARSPAIPRAGRADLEVRAWLPAGRTGPYEGRSVDVSLELRVVPAGAGS